MTGLGEWFAGKRVLVTGHTGFKGAWLTAWLRDMGANVTGLSLPPDEAGRCLYVDARVADGIESHLGDIRDATVVQRVVRDARPEVVLHLAAQSLVRRGYREPAATFETNVMGVVHLLDAVRTVDSVRAVVVVTSDKCYENHERSHRYREDDAFGGHDPYSASKGCAELVTQSYRRSFLAQAGIHVASARAGNVIGGGDWSDDRLVPDLMRGAMRDASVPIRNPDSVRPWQHVLDPLRGYLMLARALVEQGSEFAEGWNFGPGDEGAVPVRDVVQLLQRHWPRVRTAEQRDPAAPHEAVLLSLDVSKAASRLGCTPLLPLPGAIEWTAAWYRDFAEVNADAAALVARDVSRYARMT